MPEKGEATRAHWRRLWIENPAFDDDRAKPLLGLVLEDGGRMVGFFGNIPLLYFYGARPIVIANASQWGVEKPYRSQIPVLAEAYFNQKKC